MESQLFGRATEEYEEDVLKSCIISIKHDCNKGYIYIHINIYYLYNIFIYIHFYTYIPSSNLSRTFRESQLCGIQVVAQNCHRNSISPPRF